MNTNVVGAIFKRNFLAYFNSPTGYVFICVFVALNSLAAFWPNDFFNANLDNLDQLNKYLPFILLVFIPAITMSVWAEERRQGTDELLLTIPATDLDVVVGKYLAIVAIYSVALMFSLVCNFLVLEWLGNPDLGLFLATYVGYWVVGLAMLSIGMVASFLTSNLTVGFVLGAAFNAPLVFMSMADVILPLKSAETVGAWSISEQFRDFGRGVISLPALAYFISIVVVMLYLSMVLIGRRHWQGRRGGEALGGHYFVRTLALVLAAAWLVMLCDRTGARADISQEKLSSLSPETIKLIHNLQPKQTVNIDAYVSPEMPESYVQTRLNLLSALREFKAIGSNKLHVQIHETEPLSEEADRAEKLFGITAKQVFSRTRGAMKADDIYMGVAFTAGLNKVVVPFFDYGTPVEYELVRSITTVAQSDRKTLGVLITDAKLFGGFDQMTMSPTRNQPIIDELEKQYDVKQVNPEQAITEKYDVLLAIQPSSLGPQQMDHFIAAVESGQPTAIFEDPFPMDPSVPGTAAPKTPPQNPMGMMGGRPQGGPKGNIGRLWSDLGVDFAADQVVWQRYNPYPRLGYLPDEVVFVDRGASKDQVFNPSDPITSGLQEMIFLFPGWIKPLNATSLQIKPLAVTGENTGFVLANDLMQRNFFGGRGGLNPRRHLIPTRDEYVLAVHIQGTLKDNLPMSDKPPETAPPAAAAAKPEAKPADRKVNVVLVADIDVMYADFFELRNQAGDPNRGDVNLNPDNVTFVLNILDSLAGDDRYIAIRSRRPAHRTLETVELVTAGARKDALETRERSMKDFDDAKKKAQAEFDAEIKKIEDSDLDPQQKLIRLEMVREVLQRRLQAQTDRLQKDLDLKTKKIDRDLALQVRSVQNHYKLWAVFLPPIFPLLVGMAVFFHRRAGEREGVARSRLR